MQDFVRWIEIDLDAISYNFHQIRKLVPDRVKIMSVVKADAYGHGALQVAEALVQGKTDMFAVTTVEEGMELVKGGIRLPILIFAPLLPFQVATVMNNGLIPTLDSLDSLDALGKWTEENSVQGQFHLKVETGMGRTGIGAGEIPNFLKRMHQYPGVSMGGVYSHFATAMMKEKTYAQVQLKKFLEIVQEIKKEISDVGLTHIANSAGILDLPEAYLDMVRVGTLLYGQFPSQYVSRSIELKDPWQMKGRIVSVKKLMPGDSVGYGRDYMVTKPLEVGIVPVGYADGFGVLPHTRPAKFYDLVKSTAKIFSQVLGVVPPNYVFQGKNRLPVIGRIGMQLSMVDITGQNIVPGAEVNIPMRRTTSGSRLPRVFYRGGKITCVRSISQCFSEMD